MSKAYGQGSSTSTPIHILMERIVVLAYTDFMLLGLLAMSVKQLPEIFQTIQSIGNQVAIDQRYKNQLRKVSLRGVLCLIIMVGLELILSLIRFFFYFQYLFLPFIHRKRRYR